MTFLALAKVYLPKEGFSFEGSITTLDQGGLGMFSQGSIEVNSPIEILITFRHGTDAIRKECVHGRVVRVNIGVDGNTFGIEFNEKIQQGKNPALHQYFTQAQSKIA